MDSSELAPSLDYSLRDTAPGLVQVNGRGESRLLECRVLNGNVSPSEISDFVHILNNAWGSFFPIDEGMMMARLSSRPFFISAYDMKRQPATLLETKGVTLDPDILAQIERKFPGNDQESIQKRAYEVCGFMPKNYAELTGNGTWKNGEINSGQRPNVLVLVDITAHPERKGSAAAIIQYFQRMFDDRGMFSKPANLSEIRYGITFTPAGDEKAANLHLANGAFDTRYVARNARPNFSRPDVNYFCYLAPGHNPMPKERLDIRKA